MKSFLPHNFSFKPVSKTLPLRLKLKTSAFVILKEILLAFSHLESDLRSLFTYLLIPFTVLLIFKKQVIFDYTLISQ